MKLFHNLIALAMLVVLLAPTKAHALDQLCDTAFEDCRQTLLDMIENEKVAIDVGMWFMEDQRFSAAIVRRVKSGDQIRVRILMDTRSSVQHPAQTAILDILARGHLASDGTVVGVPIQMRQRIAKGIEHWKVMIFHGQGKLYFGSANFSEDAFENSAPYTNYVDETIYFTDNAGFLGSLITRFEDAWTDTTSYAWYANPSDPPVRRYNAFPVDPELNIPPGEDFINRTVGRLNVEKTQIDVLMYRIDDDRATIAMINAHHRSVPIRLLVDPQMYRDPTRHTIADDFDRMYAAGIPTKVTVHGGINHGKLAILHGQGMAIFGSSNWTRPSANSQHENNWFTKQAFVFDYFKQYFDRRWNNSNPIGAIESGPFVPLPPDRPVHSAPADVEVGVATAGVRLRWSGGLWGQYYDIYFGTTPDPPLFAANRFLGPNAPALPTHSFQLPTLAPATTYYWKVTGRTAANLARTSAVGSFTTAGTPAPPPEGATTVVLWTANLPPANLTGDWTSIADVNAAGGAALHNPNRSRAKTAPALASPANYFEASFNAMAGVPYHMWIRMRAQTNSVSNDSIHVQFSDSVDAVGNPMARIGSTSSLEPVLQDGPQGGAPQGYGWTDNGWGSPGPHVYFAATGTHVVRVQQREDGAIVDQIVLSPDTYIMSPPGAHYNDATILAPSDGSAPPPPPPPAADQTIVLRTADLMAAQVRGNWLRHVDGTAAGGAALRNADLGAAKIGPALAAPLNSFEASFIAEAGRAYHVWIRGRADLNSLANDSIHLQFDNAVDSAGQPILRIGTTSSAEPVLQAGPTGAAPSGWGWADTGWGAPGRDIYFATPGVQTLRVQQREDGITIDQIVLSPDTYLVTAPGAPRDDMTILPARGGTAPPPPPASDRTIVLWPGAPATLLNGTWQRAADTAAAGALAVWNPNANAGKIGPARISPANFFEIPFSADAATPYHVWMRMRAEGNSLSNDSVHLQFSDSVDSTGASYARTGTSSSMEFVLQAGPSGASPRGWGWTENGWTAVGPHIYFAESGSKTLRIQQREDGPYIDQIVISPDAYLNASPGARRDDTVILSEQQP
jgi:phosphatidylserine/phosphatidylglycerophosphate/cardiolipin synthase-like enzyme